ncbi:MAG TPA: alpha-L-fucosidase [Gemmatimonadales bacterium]|nr:alpha-L-fucosidase [Gemmatimonadales bacterium]
MSKESGGIGRMDKFGRRDFLATTLAMATLPTIARAPRRTRPAPTPQQLGWQRDELAMFIHFGVNTFSNREWGDGTEDPATFAPTALDATQWARAARAAGFRAMILTAKHHDGFCLWPTTTTPHSVAQSPFRGGAGDVVGEFAMACRREGLRVGLYLSPWDRNAPSYGDSPRYNDLYVAQLTELLTRYGRIHEVWFDGANGEGPNGKRQRYDWPRFWATVRRLQPEAVIFSDAGPDLRWIGNERGAAGETNWSTVDPRVITEPGMSGPAVMRQLQEGDPDGSVWRPGETDVSIRPGWFWHPAEDGSVRSADDLVELYFSSVGRNSKLLLNVPPTRAGRLHETDIAHLNAMRERLDTMFGTPMTGSNMAWQSTGASSASALLDGLPAEGRISVIDLREEITMGQRVARYVVEARDQDGWEEVARGTTIGCRRLHRIAPRHVSGLRLRLLETVDQPLPVAIRTYHAG